MYLKCLTAVFSLLVQVAAIPSGLSRRADAFIDPRVNGGSMLDNGRFDQTQRETGLSETIAQLEAVEGSHSMYLPISATPARPAYPDTHPRSSFQGTALPEHSVMLGSSTLPRLSDCESASNFKAPREMLMSGQPAQRNALEFT